jgi:hypothetical protein
MGLSSECTTCAICLNTVRETRQNPALRCGHVFHSHCIEDWKSRGKQTCPICRKIFDGSNFRVTVKIENLIHESNVIRQVDGAYIFDTLDAFFDIDNTDELESLLSDFGVSMSDFDALILDAE